MGDPREQFLVLRRDAGPILEALNATLAIGETIARFRDGAARTYVRFLEEARRLQRAAERAGAPGLAAVCDGVIRRVLELELAEHVPTDAEMRLLSAWPELLSDYLGAPADPGPQEALLAHLGDPAWGAGNTADEIDGIAELFASADRASAADGLAQDDALEVEDATSGPDAASLDFSCGTGLAEGELAAGVALPEATAQDALLAAAEAFTESLTQDDPSAGAAQADVAAGIERLARAAESASLPDLAAILDRAAAAAAAAEVPTDAERVLELPLFVMDCVAAPEDAAVRDALDAFVARLASPAPSGSDANAPEDAEPLPVERDADLDGAAAEAAALEPPATDLEPTDDAETPEASGTPLLQQVDEEMFGLFTIELAAIQDVLNAALAAIKSPDESDDARRDALDSYTEQLERVGTAAGAIGLVALARVLGRLRSQIVAGRDVGLSPPQAELLAGVPERLQSYFASPTDPSAASALLDLLVDAAWVQPLGDEEARTLAAALTAVELRSAETEARATRASTDDVSLALPEDLNPELLDGLLLELPIQTSAFTDAIKRIIEGEGSLKDVEIAKRAAHTLKGAANTVGVRGIASLTHHLEDILIALGEHGALPNMGLAQTLGYAADCVESMSEALTGAGEPPVDAASVLQDVLNWANRIDRDGAECAAAEMSARADGAEAPRDGGTDGSKEPGAAAGPMLRVPARVVDELLRLVGETITSTAQIQNRLKNTADQARAIGAQHAMFQNLVAELERLVDLRGIAAPLQHAGRPGDFDALEFEQFSELHTVARRLTEVATDSRELGAAAEEQLTALRELLEDHSRLHLQSQGAVLRTRMVPVASVVSRFHRAVRQAGRILDKNVGLKVRGADTLVDSNLLNDLIDPLMHVLRNAVDHGIETTDRRSALGKDPVGHIELSFQREGDYIVVRCRDDGGGLDLPAIRRAAVRKGLIEDAARLSDDELARLILAPGFSTREEATQISGRGIGMDVVQSRVLDLKGAVHLRTDRGRGLTVELRVPATLLSAHALLLRVRNAIVAVSTRGIEDIHYAEARELRTVGTELTYQIENAVHDVAKLDEVLNLPGDRRAGERSGFPLLIVRLDSGAARAVMAQEVLETRNLVVKNLGRYVPKIRGVVGAAILGDGSVASVVDLPELLRSESQRETGWSGTTTGLSPGSAGQRQSAAARAIVVDDSISARRALAKVARDAGFEVRAAIDGLEAVALLERMTPDIILTDMEMPRMNGLELTGHVRARAETRDIPVIMVTSRSTDKHRKQAEAAGVNVYLTKPFSEETLLKHIGLLAKRKQAA